MEHSAAERFTSNAGEPGSTTAETLAALPDGLMVPEGSTASDRRLSDVLTLYRTIFLQSPDPIVILDRFGHYIEQNPAHRDHLGFSDEDLRGRSPGIHVGEETFALMFAELQRTGQLRREVASVGKNGREHIVDLSAFAVNDRLGRPVCFVAINRDVTADRQASALLERRLEELQTLYRMSDALGHAMALEQIFDEALDGLRRALAADRASILLFDDDGVMRFKAWRGLSDDYRSRVEGHSPWKRDTVGALPVVVPDVRTDPDLAPLLPVLDAEGIRSLVFIPLTDTRGVLGKFMVYFDAPHDWTDAESRLARTIARHVCMAIVRHRGEVEIREANRAKSVFLATMSHELRTPLNAIAGYTDLLDAGIHGAMPTPQREAIQRIQANQRHLLRLIDDVLSFAKLEAGHLEFEIADVPLQETLDGTRALIEPQLLAKGITLDFQRGDPSITCRADRAKMQQVIVNLLSNAWKFTPGGGTVTVTWSAAEREVSVEVRDTGPGIAPAHLETIFAPFVQLQTGFRRKAEGTGLGLAISRELARAMGGEVSVVSEIGAGSKFTLTLPR